MVCATSDARVGTDYDAPGGFAAPSRSRTAEIAGPGVSVIASVVRRANRLLRVARIPSGSNSLDRLAATSYAITSEATP